VQKTTNYKELPPGKHLECCDLLSPCLIIAPGGTQSTEKKRLTELHLLILSA
jgi:hypothetical protein